MDQATGLATDPPTDHDLSPYARAKRPDVAALAPTDANPDKGGDLNPAPGRWIGARRWRPVAAGDGPVTHRSPDKVPRLLVIAREDVHASEATTTRAPET
jgi:hypothetical protein